MKNTFTVSADEFDDILVFKKCQLTQCPHGYRFQATYELNDSDPVVESIHISPFGYGAVSVWIYHNMGSLLHRYFLADC